MPLLNIEQILKKMTTFVTIFGRLKVGLALSGQKIELPVKRYDQKSSLNKKKGLASPVLSVRSG